MTDKETEKLRRRLKQIHDRVNWMADEEARSAWVNGFAARGGLMSEKLALLDEADRILTKLMKK